MSCCLETLAKKISFPYRWISEGILWPSNGYQIGSIFLLPNDNCSFSAISSLLGDIHTLRKPNFRYFGPPHPHLFEDGTRDSYTATIPYWKFSFTFFQRNTIATAILNAQKSIQLNLEFFV